MALPTGFLARWKRKCAAESKEPASPQSSPEKGPLIYNSDNSPKFRARTFYRKIPALFEPNYSSCSPSNSDATSSNTSGSQKMVLRTRTNIPSLSQKSERGRHSSAPAGKDHKLSKSSPAQSGSKRAQSQNVSKKSSPVSSTDGKRFFKHRSPGSASKSLGSIVIQKGFKLKFLPHRDDSKEPKRKKNASRKRSSSTSQVSKRRKVQINSPSFDFEDDENEVAVSDISFNRKGEDRDLDESMIVQIGSPGPPNLKLDDSALASPQVKSSRAERMKKREQMKASTPLGMITPDNDSSCFAALDESPDTTVSLLSEKPSILDSQSDLNSLQSSPQLNPRYAKLPSQKLQGSFSGSEESQSVLNADEKSPSLFDSSKSESAMETCAMSQSSDISRRSGQLQQTGRGGSSSTQKSPLNSQDSENRSPCLFSTASSASSATPKQKEARPSTSVTMKRRKSEDSLLISSFVSSKKLYPLFFPGYKDKTSSPTYTRSIPAAEGKLAKRAVTDAAQMILDAGQKKFGATQCKICAMVYTHADPTDEATHNKFHSSLVHALKFPGWRKERMIEEFADEGSRVIVVYPEDPRYTHKKVEEINAVVSQELGSVDSLLSFVATAKVFLYISDEKRVEGYCLAESIREGFRVIPNSQGSERPWCCSTQPKRAVVGISRLWVYGPRRGRNIATRLLDCVREYFEYGVLIDKNELAFSDPTVDGKKFAIKYTGREDFLVYRFS